MNFHESLYSKDPGGGESNDDYRSRSSSREQERDRDRVKRQEHRNSRDRDYRQRDRDYDNGRGRYESSSSSRRHTSIDYGDKDERRGYRDRDKYDRDYDRGHDREKSHDRDERDFGREKDYERGKDRDRDDRGRSYDRDHDRDYDRKDRERSYDRSSREEYRDDVPNNTVMARGLPSQITEQDIRNETERCGLKPKDVRLMRNKDTGDSRGFAFVQFNLLSEAVRWKELTRGVVCFDKQTRSTLHYSIPKDALNADRSHLTRADWTCSKCGVNNFRRRDFCFKCNFLRDDIDSRSTDGGEEVTNHPSNTLLFRNLDVLTSEERVLTMLGQITTLPIKSLKVAKDKMTNTSRGFAYVELHSTSEATQLHDLLLSMAGNFFVDGRPVTVSYARRSLTSMNGSASANAASAALAAAQWTNQEEATIQSFGEAATNLGTVMVDSVTYHRYPVPDISSYTYDKDSGFYYDASTGLYYDSNSQYYYNSESQQYLYWDGEHQTYIPAPTDTTATTTTAGTEEATTAVVSCAPTTYQAPDTTSTIDATKSKKAKPAATTEEMKPDQEPTSEKGKKQDKVKIAKKIAKEMEKWAKTLNQKKENARLGLVATPMASPAVNPMADQYASSADAGFAIMEKKHGHLLGDAVRKSNDSKLSFPFHFPPSKASDPGLVAAYGGESDSDQEAEGADDSLRSLDMLKAEELKLTDWTKMACLMCKRQFPTRDALVKHQQLSDLHKKNLEQLRDAAAQQGGESYRDRARERRIKFGQPDMPPPSKLKSKYMKERDIAAPPEQPNKEGIRADNIGNKMLKAMGWSEGQGLGKTGQGTSNIIEVQQRSKTAGLGMKGSTYGVTATDSYKDAVKKSMQARFNEIE